VKDIGCSVGKLIGFVSDAETLSVLNRVANSKLLPKGPTALTSHTTATQMWHKSLSRSRGLLWYVCLRLTKQYYWSAKSRVWRILISMPLIQYKIMRLTRSTKLHCSVLVTQKLSHTVSVLRSVAAKLELRKPRSVTCWWGDGSVLYRKGMIQLVRCKGLVA
jgi:hypothetical protein